VLNRKVHVFLDAPFHTLNVRYNLIIQNKIDLKKYDLLLVYYFENIDSQEFSK
jgi:hypothetical protein